MVRTYLYLSDPLFVCYDNEGEGGGGGGEGGDPPAPTGEGGGGGKGGDGDMVPQDKVNSILAEEKRKWRQQAAEAQAKFEEEIAELRNSKSLSSEEKERLEKSLETSRAQWRTKEEQLKEDMRKNKEELTDQLQKAMSDAEGWKTRYTTSTIQRALQDAAVKGDAFNPSQVVTLLEGQARLNGEEGDASLGEVIIEMMSVNEESGKPEKLVLTPDQAVKRMQDRTDEFGNLFKSNVAAGVGGNNNTGDLPGKNGDIDLANLTHEQYVKLRKENPEVLGLSRSR